MVGRLRTSFRFGNLAEDLGLLLLKGIATVADVPRTEDVGLDAIANLLRFDSDGNCYAEDSFGVQLKAISESKVEYTGHALDWLLAQEQPLFIGRVSLDDGSIALHTMLHVNQAVLAWHAKKLTIRFGTSPHGYPWAGESGTESANVWLGEPVMRWTLQDLKQTDWSESAYRIMKRFLGIAKREYELVSFGQWTQIRWQTNDLDSIRSEFYAMKGGPDDLTTIAEKCKPVITALLMHGTSLPEESRNQLMIPLIAVVAALKDLGVDVDPSDMFTKMFFAISQQPGTNSGATDNAT